MNLSRSPLVSVDDAEVAGANGGFAELAVAVVAFAPKVPVLVPVPVDVAAVVVVDVVELAVVELACAGVDVAWPAASCAVAIFSMYLDLSSQRTDYLRAVEGEYSLELLG